MPGLRNLHKLRDPEIRAKNWRALRYALRRLWWDVARPGVRGWLRPLRHHGDL